MFLLDHRLLVLIISALISTYHRETSLEDPTTTREWGCSPFGMCAIPGRFQTRKDPNQILFMMTMYSTDWLLIGSGCLYTPLITQINQKYVCIALGVLSWWPEIDPQCFSLFFSIGIGLTCILMASVYYANIWNGLDFPFMSQSIFLANGSIYPQTEILTDNVFDASKYVCSSFFCAFNDLCWIEHAIQEAIGPAYFSATNALYLLVENLRFVCFF